MNQEQMNADLAYFKANIDLFKQQDPEPMKGYNDVVKPLPAILKGIVKDIEADLKGAKPASDNSDKVELFTKKVNALQRLSKRLKGDKKEMIEKQVGALKRMVKRLSK